MAIRSTPSIKYEACLVICKDVPNFLVVENRLKHWEETTVTGRTQTMQRKAVPIYGITSTAQKPAGHVLEHVNATQSSRKAQR